MIPFLSIRLLCREAGVDYRHVTSIEIEPQHATFYCLSLFDGKPYVTPNRKDLMRHWVTVPIDWSNA